MSQFYVYLHCRPDGEPFYVGKGGATREKRSHQFSRRSAHHQNVVAKCGGAASVGVFVFHCDSEQQALRDEQAHIAQLRNEGCRLVNQTAGGEGSRGRNHSASTRAKISAALKGKRCGPGYARTAETKEKVSRANTGRKLSDEARAGMSRSAKARDISPATRAKMAASLVGNTHGLGYKHTPEARAKISAAVRTYRAGQRATATSEDD